MAVFTKNPVSAPPAPPVRETTGHLLLRAWCILVLFLAVSGVSWNLAFGAVAGGAIAIASGIVTAVLWAVLRPAFQWRRLPWVALAYVAYAALSIAWSAWPSTSALTWLLLAITTLQGFFVAAVLTWREIIRAISSALKWAIGLSLLFELGVATVVRGPIMPGFARPAHHYDPIVYWSRGNLFNSGRLQGIWGNANLLGVVALLALIVFGILFAARAPRRTMLIVWMAVAGFLLIRAGSATTFLSLAAVVVVLAAVLLMRTTKKPAERTRYYVIYAIVGVGGIVALWFLRKPLFTLLGRNSDLTGRETIWAKVLKRAVERPFAGWGYASPWIPGDPHFDRWIIDHGQTVMQAHNMWVDLFLQLGIVGIVLMAGVYLAYIWRAWFFAVDRPRWDLVADRTYSPLTLLPTLVATVLLVQGLAESGPLILWGWMFVAMFSFKLKQAPLIGVGPAEVGAAIERGDAVSIP
ncbi:O-antigen ligase family protein [Microbacterium sp. ASV49]|uniref:O-antigen ligase family protein n=1 Tax=Microbacterium candidum TaxID=3041922 RepID=A0ABT7N0V3_9MICO|nr:O-antigen ligase family protein [Microbacterium sp. ASV49]MDL9980337.1 O-antigen ligase family protein [Microbacterium sp. ASV49]